MKKIESRTDIDFLISEFYKSALKDDKISYIFTEISKINLETHLPVIGDFWESVLFHKAIYKRNPILKHIQLNQKETLTSAHFNRWLELWEQTIRLHFTGQKAEDAIKRAKLMSILMQTKIRQSQQDGFIQ